jgi:Animal haem peroxidase
VRKPTYAAPYSGVMATQTSPPLEFGPGSCLAPSRSTDAPPEGTADKYARLFPDLPPIKEDEERLLGLAGPGSICDGGDDCSYAVDVAAGWPFFGQVIAHDITADRSPLAHWAAVERTENFRSPRANLECIYGDGPVGNPFLYRRDDPAKLLLGVNDAGEEADLPRNREGTALIGDPRNDVHIFVSQLHLAMLRLHNCVVDHLRRSAVPESAIFDEARRTVSWLYQWVIINDYLPRLVGPELVGEIETEGPRHYRPGPAPRIPLEFADAAFRYGHSQVREDFELNSRSGQLRLFPDLLGFRPVVAERAIEWDRLFDIPGRPPAQRAKLIDGTLVPSLIALPQAITGEVEAEAYSSLAGRDLQRGHAYGLPSGESVARAMGETPLSPDETALSRGGWSGDTPLWLYVLSEAEHRGDGERLGPVGGRIVAEVLIGIIDADPASYRSRQRDWTPPLPARGERFGLADMLIPLA